MSVGRPARPIPTTEQAAAAWFKARMAGKASAVDVARRLQTLLRFVPPNLLITDIDAAVVEEAIQARRLEPKLTQVKKALRGKVAVSNATVNRDLIDHTLRPILNYHHKALKFPLIPIEWDKLRLGEPKERVREFTEGELERWRAAMPPWHLPLFDFMARYGVRLGEAFFRPENVDPQGWVTIHGADRKADGDLIVPLLPEDAQAMVARATRAMNAGLDTVWFRERPMRSGEVELIPTTYRGFQSARSKAKVKAGIRNARAVHDFRHHAATKALRASGNIKTVQKLLGHASITSTARYAHADTRDVFEALRRAYDTPAKPAEEKTSDSKKERL